MEAEGRGCRDKGGLKAGGVRGALARPALRPALPREAKTPSEKGEDEDSLFLRRRLGGERPWVLPAALLSLGRPAPRTPSPQAWHHSPHQPGGGLGFLIFKVGHVVAITPVSWAVTRGKRVRHLSFAQ